MRRQPFLGNQLKPVSTISSSTTLTTATTTTTTTAASTSTTSAQTASTTTTTAATNTSSVPARTPRRPSSSGSSSRANSPVKAVHLDPIQELLAQHQQIVGNKSSALNSTATSTVAQNGVNQNQPLRQNGGTNYSSGQIQPRIRRESTGTVTSTTTPARIIPQTPLSREKSLNLKNTGSSSSNNNSSSEVVYSGNNQRQLVEHSADLDSSEMIENNNSKKVRPKSFWASWWRF